MPKRSVVALAFAPVFFALRNLSEGGGSRHNGRCTTDQMVKEDESHEEQNGFGFGRLVGDSLFTAAVFKLG